MGACARCSCSRPGGEAQAGALGQSARLLRAQVAGWGAVGGPSRAPALGQKRAERAESHAELKAALHRFGNASQEKRQPVEEVRVPADGPAGLCGACQRLSVLPPCVSPQEPPTPPNVRPKARGGRKSRK